MSKDIKLKDIIERLLREERAQNLRDYGAVCYKRDKLVALFEKTILEEKGKFADDIETEFYAETGNNSNPHREILTKVINKLLKL